MILLCHLPVAPDYIQEPIGGCYGNKQSTWKSFKYELIVFLSNYMLLGNNRFSSLKLPVRNPFPSLLR